MASLQQLSRSILERQGEHERSVARRQAIGSQRASQRKPAAGTQPVTDTETDDDDEGFAESPEEESRVLQYLDAALTDAVDDTEEGEGQEDAETTLARELRRWQKSKRTERDELDAVTQQLHSLRADVLDRISSKLLSPAEALSDARWEMADQLVSLRNAVYSSGHSDQSQKNSADDDQAAVEKSKSAFEALEEAQERLATLEAGKRWLEALSRIAQMSADVVAQARRVDISPLEYLPLYRDLHSLCDSLQRSFKPHGKTALVECALDVRRETFRAIKRRLSDAVCEAAESDEFGWPARKVSYAEVPEPQRRKFERAMRDLLRFQLEAESLWQEADGEDELDGLFAVEALVMGPVSVRFRYHFASDRPTNRLDRPEWAFTHVLDLLKDQESFVRDCLQPLIDRMGLKGVDARSELIAQLIKLPLDLLRRRMPLLLDHPPLLAHTVYQTVAFDDAIRRAGFNNKATYYSTRRSAGPDSKDQEDWPGLIHQLLTTDDWFERWLRAEKNFTDEQYDSIVGSPDAWAVVDVGLDQPEDDSETETTNFLPTRGARQVKALVEQVLDRYVNLPSIRFKYPFLATIQMPLLTSFQLRIASSLEAFETLSSAFLRAVPGALGPGGVAVDRTGMTSGVTGLQRLTRAWISAAWIRNAMRRWDDDPNYLEMYSEIVQDPEYRHRAVSDEIIGAHARSAGSSSLFELRSAQYAQLVARAEEMITRHIATEVERELKQHLTRRWDGQEAEVVDEALGPDASLLVPLTTLSTQLAHLVRSLPPLAATRVYRDVTAHLSNHIQQRVVHSGWSKFTAAGGKSLSAELDAWVEACEMGLQGAPAGSLAHRAEGPWRTLREMSRILSLPVEPPAKDGLSFVQAMALAFSDDDGAASALKKLELAELDADQMRAVMKRRVEWRR